MKLNHVLSEAAKSEAPETLQKKITPVILHHVLIFTAMNLIKCFSVFAKGQC